MYLRNHPLGRCPVHDGGLEGRDDNGVQGARVRRAGETRYLALPYDRAKPFPLTTLFCFARLRNLGEGAYVVYAFDKQDRPIF